MNPTDVSLPRKGYASRFDDFYIGELVSQVQSDENRAILFAWLTVS
jgi:hypothetical protein